MLEGTYVQTFIWAVARKILNASFYAVPSLIYSDNVTIDSIDQPNVLAASFAKNSPIPTVHYFLYSACQLINRK